jgi:enterochelin esterase family protein
MKRLLGKYGNCLMLVLSLSPFLLKAQAQPLPNLRYNNDGSVTFVLDKPESRRVRVYCDCALRNDRYNIERENLQSARMKLDSNGLFIFTTHPLAPEIYTYQFKTKGKRFVDPANADSVQVLNTKRSVFVIPGSRLSDLCFSDSLQGRSEFFEFEDSICGKTRRVVVYLPPDYDNSGQVYPVLYLLHGINGYEKAWQDKGRAVQMVDKLIQQGKSVPLIVVMPDVNPRKLVGQKENIGMLRNLLQYGSWLHRDFERAFPQMDSLLSRHYRISSDPNLRAVAGLSAGAMQSCNLANMYEQRFRYVGLFSPVVHRNQLPTNKSTNYWIGSGKADIFHSQSLRFVKKSQKLQVQCVYYETRGGHTWRNWRMHFSEFIQYIFKNNQQ